MKFFTFCFSLFFLTSCQTLFDLSKKKISVAQHYTTETKTALSVIRRKNDSYSYFLSSKKEGSISKKLDGVSSFSRDFSPWVLDRIVIDNLNPEETYTFRIRQAGVTKDKREFTTLKRGSKELVFAAASCMRYKGFPQQKQIWKELMAKKPQVIFLIGDNAYTTYNSQQAGFKDLWNFHIATRNTLEIYQSKKLTPIMAVWDDHDYGYNNGGSDYKNKEESKRVFDTFFAVPFSSEEIRKGPGVSYHWKAFGHNFVFLDDRSFRDKHYHWGENQRTWLFETLIKYPAPSWLINGNQYFGKYHTYESFERNHEKSFKRVLKNLRRVSSPVVFLSGDRHVFEIMTIKEPDLNYTTYEITASGIHSHMRDKMWVKHPNPRQKVGVSGKLNYTVFRSKALSKKSFEIKVVTYGVENKILAKDILEIKR